MEICDPIADGGEAAPGTDPPSADERRREGGRRGHPGGFRRAEPANNPSIVGPSRNWPVDRSQNRGGRRIGAFEPGALIAAVLWSLEGDALHIARVSVAPEARRRGFVRLLIAACETEARRRGVRSMTLKTRLELPENERLFERCGFARREIEAHPGFEAPTTAVMEKVLE